MCEQYLQEGLTAHPAKTFQKSTHAQFWGVSLDGKRGTVQASPKRLIPLIELTTRIARSGVATVGLLEILAGSWVSIFQCRKRLMCLLDEIYLAQQGRTSDTVIRLSPTLQDELWLLAMLGPLAVTNLRAQSVGRVFLSDASEHFKATVVADVSLCFARELHRHALARGTWSKLLTPWKLWCKMHGQLFEEEELPDGVPLVSHPIWLALAQALRFSLFQRKEVRRRRHINLLELESILEVEERLARSQGDIRYLLGSDSQVALAAILKGRSSSPRLNKVLQRGLATVIGSGLYGSYGYVPSLANVGDDPTRGVAVRSPERAVPEWLASALLGDFAAMDGWLAAQGYDPLHLANLDFLKDSSGGDGSVDRHALDSQLLAELRSVQKPGRMQRFLNSSLPEVGQKQESFTQDSKIRDTCTDATGSSVGRASAAEGRVAPVPSGCTDLVGVDQQKEKSRGHEKPCKGKKESCNKRHQDPIRTPPTSGGNKEPISAVGSSRCERVAPPEEVGKVGTTSSKEIPKGRRLRRAMAEHSNSPLLSADSREALRLLPAHMAERADSREALRLLPDSREALRLLPAHMAERADSREALRLLPDSREALRLLPAHMFLLPGGRRAPDGWDPSCLQRRGVLDLYSGDAGVARALSKKFGVWVLTVDFAHGPEQDLLQPELQALLCRLARMKTFLGLGAAPECCSFSRAVTPAVRSAEYPLGKPGISLNMQKKVAAGNSHAEFLLKILGIFVELGLAYWVENPDGSFLWMLPAWMAAGLGRQESSFVLTCASTPPLGESAPASPPAMRCGVCVVFALEVIAI